MKRYFFALSVILISAYSCGNFEETEIVENNIFSSAPFITATLPDGSTRTDFIDENWVLKAVWADNDAISVVPDYFKYNYAGLYRISAGGQTSGVFNKETDVREESGNYGIFYPGDKVKSIVQFMNFKYTGQVQKKSDPMSHLGDFYTMRKYTTDYTKVDFSDADQSACMRFILSGMTFDHPEKVTVQAISGVTPMPVFYENNIFFGGYTHYTSEAYDGQKQTSSLSIGLDGYGEESKLTVYMMMSNNPVMLPAGYKVRVKVLCAGNEYYADVAIPSGITLEAGHCHTLEVETGWKLSSADYEEYPYDGEVVTLQEKSLWNGIDLIIMGDGFINEDFQNGTYDNLMRETCDTFFGIQPMKSLRDLFNVYYVKAVSPERINAINTGANGANNSGTVTKFSTQFTPYSTSVSGDDNLVRMYAMKALTYNAEERIKDATIIVLANQAVHAGTCSNSYSTYPSYDYCQANAIAYCTLGSSSNDRKNVVYHEACGHGFGKLADEYYDNSGSYNSKWWNDLNQLHYLGFDKNVDIHVDEYIYAQWRNQLDICLTTPQNVFWSDLFGTVNDYESTATESLGVYQGGFTHMVGFCRPTKNASMSIMNGNSGQFNAISRRQMLYRARRLSGDLTKDCYGSHEELQYFLEWDAEHLPYNDSQKGNDSSLTRSLIVEEMPYGTPQYKEGHWEKGVFVNTSK